MDFALEIAENKTMDDAISRVEGMFARGDPVEDVGAAKGGVSTRSSTAVPAGREGCSSDTTGENGSEVY